MRNNQVVGGEFGIDLQSLHNDYCDNHSLDNVFTYSSGRSALYYILLDVQKRYGFSKLYLPDYLCSSIVCAAEKSQTQVVFYHLNYELEIDIDYFPLRENEKAVVLIINYFGLKNIKNQIETIRGISKEAIIIEDDVQAFYEFIKPTMLADYKFTSIRKTFPCPDGGLVKTRHELPVISAIDKFYQYKLAAGILKSMRRPEFYDDDVYLDLFEKGENQIDDEITEGMSNVSKDIIVKTNLTKTSYIRQRNTRQILEGIKLLNINTIIPVPDNSTPLFVPIWLKDRNKVRKQMFQQQIFCPVHWPLEGHNLKKGAEMAEHEMSIIVDQRYTDKDMIRVLEILERALQ